MTEADRGIEPDESTQEYRAGTAGYLRVEETDAAPDSSAGAAEPFWKRLGFDSFDAYMGYLNKEQGIVGPPPTVELPGGEIGEIENPRIPPVRGRQVNVKLRPGEADDLERAATLYTLAPSTLARLLVNRGVRAILDREG